MADRSRPRARFIVALRVVPEQKHRDGDQTANQNFRIYAKSETKNLRLGGRAHRPPPIVSRAGSSRIIAWNRMEVAIWPFVCCGAAWRFSRISSIGEWSTSYRNRMRFAYVPS